MANFSVNVTLSAKGGSICPAVLRYVDCAISLFGIVINAICVSTFWHIIRGPTRRNENHGNMFRYLFLKSVIDSGQFVIIAFEPLLFCVQCGGISWAYVTKLFHLIFSNYFGSTFATASSWLEIAATLDCYALISKSMPWLLQKSTFYIFSSISIIFPLAYVVYYFFQFTSNGVNVDGFASYTFDYRNDKIYSVLSLVEYVIRDVAVLIVLIWLNIVILIEFKKSTARRRRLEIGQSSTATTAKSLVHRALAAERKKIIMMACTGLNFFVGHVPMVVYYIPYAQQYSDICIQNCVFILYMLSYASPFLLYYGFNATFKRYVLNIFRTIK